MDGRAILPGNKYQLTIKQHVHAANCWKQFHNPAGELACLHKATGRRTALSDRNAPELIANRAWDQRAEQLSTEIEERFFGQLGHALSGNKIADPEAVSEYYFLWCFRLMAKHFPVPDQHLNGVVGTTRPMTQLQAEYMETVGYAVLGDHGVMPGQHTTGVLLRVNIDRQIAMRPKMHWAAYTAEEGEFLVPDGYQAPTLAGPDEQRPIFFPVSPTIVLINHWKAGTLTLNAVKQLNQLSYESARVHVFARDLDRCPR
ncbi:hypothetical protein ACXIUT_25615 [Achromobacter denitrificans]|uniref:hypothetical protein n=1 Tax=Achromobacter sp. 2789STDY5608633 TaxID=1806501 RepID=UPI0012E0D2DC|nr:hypothetical protein [Achromobacter sp. 2789STDY5608633]